MQIICIFTKKIQLKGYSTIVCLYKYCDQEIAEETYPFGYPRLQARTAGFRWFAESLFFAALYDDNLTGGTG